MGWVQLALLVIAIYLQVALQPKPLEPKPASFSDIDLPQVTEGTPQPVVFGDVWSSDWTVLATGNFSTTAIKKSAGKK